METTAKRTLVKSAPELWELADDEARMQVWIADLVGAAGTIAVEVTDREPERLLAWQTANGGPFGRIALEMAEKGFGTVGGRSPPITRAGNPAHPKHWRISWMSSDPPNASPSPAAEPDAGTPLPEARDLATIARLHGAPLLEGLEAHMPGAAQHAEATAGYAFAAAVGIGLDRKAAELARETAKLHDVGMVYVPAQVMQTPFADWDAEQRAGFDAHYEAGARLALGAGIPDDVCGWLLQIRERFDGQGPDELEGDAIPIVARLVRAACACDTLLASPQGGASLAERRDNAIAALRRRRAASSTRAWSTRSCGRWRPRPRRAGAEACSLSRRPTPREG